MDLKVLFSQEKFVYGLTYFISFLLMGIEYSFHGTMNSGLFIFCTMTLWILFLQIMMTEN